MEHIKFVFDTYINNDFCDYELLSKSFNSDEMYAYYDPDHNKHHLIKLFSSKITEIILSCKDENIICLPENEIIQELPTIVKEKNDNIQIFKTTNTNVKDQIGKCIESSGSNNLKVENNECLFRCENGIIQLWLDIIGINRLD